MALLNLFLELKVNIVRRREVQSSTLHSLVFKKGKSGRLQHRTVSMFSQFLKTRNFFSADSSDLLAFFHCFASKK